MSTSELDRPIWAPEDIKDEELASQEKRLREKHLLLDPRFPPEANRYMLDPMYRTTRKFWILFAMLGGMAMIFMTTWGIQMYWGLGLTGLNRPVMWALYIVNLVYFIGVGHAGTFISAALRALKIEWRRPISRAAELVTVFALMVAALFPLIHLGRSWKFYWLVPYPNARELWPSFHSPLLWDMMAIFTYLSGSILFAYLGMLPDLAMIRDHSEGWRHRLYAILSLGWHGTEKEWSNQETALNIFSYVIIPVMFSVHTVVSWDFAMSIQPGWHSSIFGPYFVAGALFSGVGAVIMTLIVLRRSMHLDYFLRAEHFNGMGMFLLLLSLTWDYFYFNDYIVAWYGNEPVEKVFSHILSSGWAAPLWFLMLFCNAIFPALTLWSRKVRTTPSALFLVALFVQLGMYLERYLIVPFTLGFNEFPYSWGVYIPQVPESLITICSFGLVAFMYVAITRLIPVIPLWEVYEGQVLHGLKRMGRALIRTKAEPD